LGSLRITKENILEKIRITEIVSDNMSTASIILEELAQAVVLKNIVPKCYNLSLKVKTKDYFCIE